MNAIMINFDGDQITVSYEEKTAVNIEKRLRQLKEALGVTWYGVAVVLGMKANEGSVRLFKRWARDPSMSSFQEMPESQWKLLLTIVQGQKPID